MSSKASFWRIRAWIVELGYVFEGNLYNRVASFSKIKSDTGILRSFAWISVKSLFWIILVLGTLVFIEEYLIKKPSWLPALSLIETNFNIEQLRLYAQLLTAIFSIYFATIGIILSAGYTRLRRDIIYMLTNEQVGSLYSRFLVNSAMFCLAATSLPFFGYEPGSIVYIIGSILTFLSILTLFPLGQRLFNFFDLKILVSSEILPSIARHIEAAARPNNSVSQAVRHSRAAQYSLEQLYYIDDRFKADNLDLQDNLPALTKNYTDLLLYYLKHKHSIDKDSYWFPRRSKYKRWFFSSDSETFMALRTSSQHLLVEEKLDHHWFESNLINRLADHIKLAFEVKDFDLVLKLIGLFSTRISAYAVQFQFEIGIQELERFKKIMEKAFVNLSPAEVDMSSKVMIGIADTWAAIGSNLCLETLSRVFTFEKELERFFEVDNWTEKSLRQLPALFQVKLAFIVKRIEFEIKIEGLRLSRPKYVQQLAVQKLLEHYKVVLPKIFDFYRNILPDFVDSLLKFEMYVPATQVVLASLHSHWKLPSRFDELAQLVDRYHKYEHYTEEQYKLPEINIAELTRQLASVRADAIERLADVNMVDHIFDPKQNDELPDYFGQIYSELAEACVNALEQNDEEKLYKVLPMFMSLTFLAADSRFSDPSLDINDEYRLHLISTVTNDLASVLGFAILYGAYFNNDELHLAALARFNDLIDLAVDKQQYLKRMLLISNSYNFSQVMPIRSEMRFNWKISFEKRAYKDGFGDQIGMISGAPHPNKTVRVFLRSNVDASHLFFATHILPQLDQDFEIDYQITSLARNLGEEE